MCAPVVKIKYHFLRSANTRTSRVLLLLRSIADTRKVRLQFFLAIALHPLRFLNLQDFLSPELNEILPQSSSSPVLRLLRENVKNIEHITLCDAPGCPLSDELL